MKTIEQEWQNFSSEVIPEGAPDYQFDDMKLAFIAGFACCHFRMLSVADDDKNIALNTITEQHKEILTLNAYYKKLYDGSLL